MRRRAQAAVALVAGALAAGCYLKPSATNAPLIAPGGVRVSLLGQDCEDHRGGRGDPVSRDLGVKVRVDNPTGQPLRIAEESIRLAVDSYSGGLRSPTVVDVAPHSSATVTMTFLHHALCEPDRQFAIVWNDALVLGDRPLAMANLVFHP